MAKEQPEFEEINLRDYLEVLFRRKGIILGIFLICVISTVIVSFFILKPVYQSTARIIITQPSLRKITEFKSYEDFMNFQALNPVVYSPETYVQLLKNPSLEEKVIETLNLKDKIQKEFSLEDLEKISSIQIVSQVIEINVESNEATLAKDIANAWARLFVEENKQEKLKIYSILKNNFESKLSAAKRQLNNVEKEKREFDEKGKSALLKKESEEKSSHLIEAKSKILELQSSIGVERAKIKELQRQLKEEKEVIVLTESIAKHPLLDRVTNQIARDALSNLQVESEYINPIYQNIKTQLGSSKVNLAIYQQELTQLKEEAQDLPAKIEKLKKELSKEVITEQRINRGFKLAEDTYNKSSYQLEQIKGAEFIQGEDVGIASLARAAKKSVKPNKKQNIAVSGVLGLLIGIVAAFGVEWWSRGKDEENNDKKIKEKNHVSRNT